MIWSSREKQRKKSKLILLFLRIIFYYNSSGIELLFQPVFSLLAHFSFSKAKGSSQNLLDHLVHLKNPHITSKYKLTNGIKSNNDIHQLLSKSCNLFINKVNVIYNDHNEAIREDIFINTGIQKLIHKYDIIATNIERIIYITNQWTQNMNLLNLQEWLLKPLIIPIIKIL